MSDWQDIWSKSGTEQLWSIPDPKVEQIIEAWKTEGQIRRVLDLGCGIGRHTYVLAKSGFEVYGSDHSQTAIESCQRWFKAEGLTGQFWCGEMDEIPYQDAYFDAILAFNSIYHGTPEVVERVTKLIAEKTREGGSCFVTMPSCNNRLYGRGKEIAPNTFISPGMYGALFQGGGEAGVPHHFSSRDDIEHYFGQSYLVSLEEVEFQIASFAQDNQKVVWRRVPKSHFWRIIGRKVSNESRLVTQNKIAG